MADVTLKQVIIPEVMVAKATAQFLAEEPIDQEQEIIDGVPQFNEDESPKMIDSYTLKEWIHRDMINHLHTVCARGKKKINKQQSDKNLFI